MKIATSQKCVNIFAPNFAYLFGTKLCTNVLLCAVFTWHTSSWQKRNLQERISRITTEQKVMTLIFLCLRAT